MKNDRTKTMSIIVLKPSFDSMCHPQYNVKKCVKMVEVFRTTVAIAFYCFIMIKQFLSIVPYLIKIDKYLNRFSLFIVDLSWSARTFYTRQGTIFNKSYHYVVRRSKSTYVTQHHYLPLFCFLSVFLINDNSILWF